ncbi:hypothetical protein SAMN05192559_101485 [Halobacillus karajensis]|uniref:hypothetical protein n=1 Tax=Halobacillus karajensis TaxID=195088 RepID=UPI0008A7C87E|nr:hypothetical protein [Halobacillus karajensis]SEH44866.1 hypothetical protein SAMN05192559_101485 [Halobacillus karajensis]
MRKWLGLLFVFGLLVGCADNAADRAIQQFTSSTKNELHFVYFYEEEPPDAKIRSQLNGMKVYLSRKNVTATISYQKIATDKNYEELLNVKDGQIIVFDYKGIRFNARNVHVLEGMVLQMQMDA